MATKAESLLNEAGKPDPNVWNRHRPVPAPLNDGATVPNATPQTVLVPIAGAKTVTLRGKFNQSGVLSHAYRRSPPNVDTAYTLSNPADKNIVANTEFFETITPEGESILALTFTPGGTDTVITFFDIMQVNF